MLNPSSACRDAPPGSSFVSGRSIPYPLSCTFAQRIGHSLMTPWRRSSGCAIGTLTWFLVAYCRAGTSVALNRHRGRGQPASRGPHSRHVRIGQADAL